MPFSSHIKPPISSLADYPPGWSDLRQVRDNYLLFNHKRLEFARNLGTPSHRLFIDVLPALLHHNHPMLPGFCGSTTPCGLSGFNPTQQQKEQLATLARSFKPTHDQYQAPDILAIYTMGSLGSLAQNTLSDIDIWLCYRPDLDVTALQKLKEKTGRIEDWARSINIDTTIFLMDHQAFAWGRRMRLNKESSGSTQHFLLLDEFYRTAIWLGGHLPAWIFICDNKIQGINEERCLPEELNVNSNPLLDFGSVSQIPPAECISAAIWHLYKAIESPYKSIIKLLLIEVYISLGEASSYLSARFKHWLHTITPGSNSTIEEYDPYISAYIAIEDYLLKSGQQQRLELLRRCFYFKIAHPRSKNRNSSQQQKQHIIERMTSLWGWDEATLRHLDNRDNWKIATVTIEQRYILDQLNNSYRFILDYCRTRNQDKGFSYRELNILGRKLRAAFQKKTGKIDWINPNISRNISEELLYISYKPHNGWQVTFAAEAGVAANRRRKSISKGSLIELLVWLHCNRIMTAESRLQLDTSSSPVPLEKCRKTLDQLIPAPLKLADHNHFLSRRSLLTKVVIFFHSFDSQKNRPQTDDYLHRHCAIDIISLNSWNEIHCESREGPVVQLLCELFTLLLSSMQTHAKTHFHFFDESIAQLLSARLGRLYKDLFDFFYAEDNGRYLLKSQQQFILLNRHPELPAMQLIPHEAALYRSLSTRLGSYASLRVDSTTLANHETVLFASRKQAAGIELFVSTKAHKADVVIVDERGVFSRLTLDYSLREQSLAPLLLFLRAVNQRLTRREIGETNPLDITPIALFHIHQDCGHWHKDPFYVHTGGQQSQLLEVSAVAEIIAGQLCFTLKCGQHTLSECRSGKAIYQQLALLIRQHNRRHPNNSSTPGYYISDLDISLCHSQLQIKGEAGTADYLHIKQQLDHRISAVLARPC